MTIRGGSKQKVQNVVCRNSVIVTQCAMRYQSLACGSLIADFLCPYLAVISIMCGAVQPFPFFPFKV